MPQVLSPPPSLPVLRRSQLPCLPLHAHLCLEALPIPKNRGERQHTSATIEADGAVASVDVAIHLDSVPPLRVPDISDADVVVLAPEEGDSVEPLPVTHDVARGRPTLA